MKLLYGGADRVFVKQGARPRPAQSHGCCFQRLFEAQTEKRADALAVVDPAADEQLTYRELNRRANRLAHRLKERGVGSEARVGLLMGRCLDLVVGFLGILKAGGAYVPLDSADPRERLEFTLEDARGALLVTHRYLINQLFDKVAHERVVVCLDSERDTIRHLSSDAPAVEIRPESAAYVIYTSGSTGRPKGVVIEQQALAWYAAVCIAHYAIVPEDRILQFSSTSFDISVGEIFACLAGGATLVLRDDTMAASVAEFLKRCREWSITVLFPPTAFWHELALGVAADPGLFPTSLRLVSFGGERVLPERVADWRRAMARRDTGRRVRLFNGYGPTEATVEAVLHELSDDGGDRGTPGDVPIGEPIDGVRVEVLDHRLRAVPAGETGELCIASRGLARGYFNRPAATAELLVPDPFTERSDDRPSGRRLYRTGDRVRFRPDGNLEVLGRLDNQVKIRGFRVEPEEIEAVLSGHPAVRAAAVVVREEVPGAPGSRRLVAYAVAQAPSGPAPVTELRAFLHNTLPDYMVPAAFVFLDALPLTPNGKVDRAALGRRALAASDPPRPELEQGYVSPRTPAEEVLARIWSEVLRLEKVGVHDNFFELGGDSILGIRIVAKAHQAGLRLSPKDLFQHHTVAELAELHVPGAPVPGATGAPEVRDERRSTTRRPVTGLVPLTPIQRWFFFDAELPEPWHFNQSMLLETYQPMAPGVLERTIEQLLAHHDALRLRYVGEAASCRQLHAGPEGRVPFTWLDLSQMGRRELPAALEAAGTDLQASLDLAAGPLLRVAYFDLGRRDGARRPRPGRLLITIHHLAVDGVSWSILLADLESTYRQIALGQPVRLPPKTTSYKQWAEHLMTHARSAAVRRELDYWLAVLGTSRRCLPVDFPGGDNLQASADTVSVSLDAEQTRLLLRRVPTAYRTQINDVLLTVLALALSSRRGRRSLFLDLEGHGREEIFDGVDLSRTVGWFTTTFPICLDLGEARTEGEALKTVKEQLRTLPRRGMGYYLLRYLSADPEVSVKLRSLPQPELAFNYLGQLDALFAGSRRSQAPMFGPADEPIGPRRSRLGRRGYLLEIEGYVRRERLWINWHFSRNLHRRTTIERLAHGFVEELEALIAHCLSPAAGGYTPSDFPLAGLDSESLDRLVGTDRGIEDVYPLSPMQEGMLFHTLYAPERAVYFEQSSWALGGDLDTTAFHDAWGRVVERHSILRTAFVWQDLERPLQVVYRQVELPWQEHDWRHFGAGRQTALLKDLLAADRRRGFELSRAPLLRLIVVRWAEKSYRFIWSAHHVLLDGWSISVIFEEVFAFYQALRRGQLAERRRPCLFRDYIAWLGRRDLAPAETFWRRALAGFNLPTPLPGATLGAPRAGEPEPGAAEFADELLGLSAAVTSELERLARRHRLTLNTLVQGAWALLLARYSCADEVVFGVTVSGRPASLPGSDSIVGLLINTLPMRSRPASREPLLPWLERLQRQNLELRQYEHTPLAKIQSWSELPRQLALFESILVFENYPVESPLERDQQRDGLVISHFLGYSETNYPLALGVLPGSELVLHASYDRSRFEPAAMPRLLGHLRVLLEGMTTDRSLAALALGALPLLTRGERHQLLVEWNDTGARQSEPTFQSLFEARARQAPEALAVVDLTAGRQLTYRQLERWANRLARCLARRGVGLEVRVGLLMERSLDVVVAILAILKAGGAYVPLDPAYPRQRLSFIVEDSGIAVLLTQQPGGRPSGCQPRACDPGLKKLRIIDPDQVDPHHDIESPVLAVRPESAAYVIYTSGSGGTPKGVVVEHRSLAWYAVAAVGHYAMLPGDRTLQFSSISFDISVEEIFPSLACGATLVLRTGAMARSVAEFARSCREASITCLFLPTAFWHELAAAAASDPALLPPSLRLAAFGGEPVLPERIFDWRRAVRRVRLLNTYGPTETTVVATLYELTGKGRDEGPADESSIGRPVANTRIYVLNRDLRAVPIGVAGELCIVGRGVARGYLGRPATTAERFVPNPYAGHRAAGDRLYRSGDLVRFPGAGNLEILGRLDDQVKIRGFRIEPGEIETVLRQHPAVREAVVVGERSSNDRHSRPARLVAYVVPDARSAALVPDELQEQWQQEHVAHWQTLHEDLFFQTGSRQTGSRQTGSRQTGSRQTGSRQTGSRQTGSRAPHDPRFRSVGWDSSYTGEPIPAEEMLEWVEETVARILGLPANGSGGESRRVLELGCGDGLLLLRIAPRCVLYVGTDFSRTVLDLLGPQLASPGRQLPQVRLLHQSAADFGGIEAGGFDTVVLNSVVQYFPSIGYLRRVLEGAVEASAPGGTIFVGDVRSLPLLDAFCASVELHKANLSLSLDELRKRIRRRRRQERELVIDPAFFVALRRELPRVRNVRIVPKAGRAHNELTLFRYDVILELDASQADGEPENAAWLDWRREQLTLAAVRQYLEEHDPPALRLRRVPNRRLSRDVRLLELLSSPDGIEPGPPRTVAELEQALRGSASDGIEPADIQGLSGEIPFSIELSWLWPRPDGSYDVIFRRRRENRELLQQQPFA